MADKMREMLESKLLSFHESSSTMKEFLNYARKLEKDQVDFTNLCQADMSGLERFEKHLE